MAETERQATSILSCSDLAVGFLRGPMPNQKRQGLCESDLNLNRLEVIKVYVQFCHAIVSKNAACAPKSVASQEIAFNLFSPLQCKVRTGR